MGSQSFYNSVKIQLRKKRQNAKVTKYKKTEYKYDKTQEDKTQKWQYTERQNTIMT